MPENDDTGPHSLLTVSGDDVQALIRKLLDGAPDAMAVVDSQGRIVLFNLQAEQLFGYTREELLGCDVERLIPERLRGTHIRHRAQFLRAPALRPMGTGRELYGRRRDGTEFPIEISLSPVATASELLTAASIRDISDRKRQEQEMRFIQEQLLNAVESIQGAFAIFDAQDRLVLCNQNFRQLVRPSARDDWRALVERSVAAGVFDLDTDTPERFVERFLAYHHAPEGPLDATTRDGRKLRIVERPTSGGGRVATIWDVTADVEQAEELRNARSLAEAASSAKSEFLASMSHELRTPLNAILGFAQLLQRDKKTPLSERQLERVGHVLKGGEHLLRLIDEVLDLARIEAGRLTVSLEPVALPSVLDEVKTTLDSLALGNQISVSIVPAGDALPEVIADRTRLKQILMNYGSNAIKYGRPGGTVQFEAYALAQRVRIAVRDDGIGIPSDKHDKLFQPFQRAGQEAGPIEGTGIGLTITKRLAELMHGAVGFDSAVGRGSVFWIELPIPPRAEPIYTCHAPSGGEPREHGHRDGPRLRIVYIEDNPSNVAFMHDFALDYAGIELLTAPSAELGIELVRTQLPDVVIMDLNLPGMNGLDATARLRALPETRDIPVIGLSAAAMVRDAKRVSEAGFYRYLTKPVRVDELSRTLDELVALLGARARR